jgi:hypothetical protein
MWKKDRRELAQIAAELCRRGYQAEHLAQSLANSHYLGKDRSLAGKLLRPLIIKEWYKLNGGLTEDQEQANDMARQLKAEGWKPIFDEQGRCFWYHQALEISVNNQGGGFPNFHIATLNTYNSATREMINSREN